MAYRAYPSIVKGLLLEHLLMQRNLNFNKLLVYLLIFLQDYFIFVQIEIKSHPSPIEAPRVVGGNIKKFTFPLLNGRRKLLK